MPDRGTPWVLIPGLNNSSSAWQPFLASVPDGIDAHAIDLPASEDIDAIAEAVIGRLPDEFVLVGHSFGGYVAAAIADRHPGRVCGIVLVNSSAGADSEAQRTARLDRIAAVRPENYEDTAMAAAASSYHPDHLAPDSATAERLLAARRDGIREYGYERFVAHSAAAAGRPDRTSCIRASGIPSLVVTADDDRVIPPEIQRESARAVGAEQRVLGPAGHMLPAEQPEALAAAVAAWAVALPARASAQGRTPNNGSEQTMSEQMPLPHHVIAGEGATTVFLLHGAYGDGRYFEHLRDRLVGAGYRVVIWDCPGYAGTAIPDDSSIESHAAALARLVTTVGGARNVLLGHSMGGIIAPAAANLLGDRVDALVLSHTSPGLGTRTPEEQQQFIAERIDPIEGGQSVGDYAPELLKSMMGQDASGPLVDRVFDVVCAMSTETFKTSMRAIINYKGGVAALGNIAVPTLVIAGENDPACPPEGMRTIHELVPGSRYRETAGVGHYGFAEAPEEYERTVLDFLAGLPAGKAA